MILKFQNLKNNFNIYTFETKMSQRNYFPFNYFWW